MEIILPGDVSYIINKLEEAGYEAYAVGGCIRDTLLGRKPLDWDITTSAKPSFVKTVGTLEVLNLQVTCILTLHAGILRLMQWPIIIKTGL